MGLKGAERYRKIRELFDATVAKPIAERAVYLREACDDDDELEREVTGLLQADEEAGAFLEEEAADASGWKRDGEFRGNERFLVIRRLGAGGQGVVYLTFDRREKAVVALKTLPQANALTVGRLKREFRALAGIGHRNLVTLYELISAEEQWFFTMEFVDGLDFCHSPGGDWEGVRGAMEQLAEGVEALHEAGKLHCDLKPNNVLMERDGRVLILDFGLTMEADTVRGEAGPFVVGTPDYMAPEQAARGKLSAATDWYSAGVMLYEVLTGRLPFEGTAHEVVDQKQRRVPRAPRELRPDVPTDLNELSMDLLQIDAARRPDGREILRRLRQEAVRGQHPVARAGNVLIGRGAELEKLWAAFHRAQAGEATTVWVSGPSGAGKTALVSWFAGELKKQECLVLSGRCYERESIPFKALDNVVDSLNEHLKRLSRPELARILPEDMAFLVRLFPVLQEAVILSGRWFRTVETPEPRELRMHGFAVLLELMASTAAGKPLVVFIDDLQWGDLDSAPLLLDLGRSKRRLPILFVACFRSEEKESSPLLKKLLGPAESDAVWLPVGELDLATARDLAFGLLDGEGDGSRESAEWIARESGGNPFLVGELAKHSRERPRSLEEILQLEMAALPQACRSLLELVAVAGQPVDAAVAGAAASLGSGVRAEVARLSAARLVRIRDTNSGPQLETYHDRIRYTLVEGMEAGVRKGCHRRLAMEWESSERRDCRAMAIHFHAAGMLDRAGKYATEAADEAYASLAFDSAAQFYRMALDSSNGSEGGALRQKLGDALSNSGRSPEAGEAYLAAAGQATGRQRFELEWRAATQFLQGGRVEQSLPLFREALGAVGVNLHASAWRAVGSFLFWSAVILIRGLRYRERPEEEIGEKELLRADICYSMAQGLALIETIRALPFHAKGILLALRCGEPYRLSKAFSIEAGRRALAGARKRVEVEGLLREAEALAERGKHPHGPALVGVTRGVAAFLQGEWGQAVEVLRKTETVLKERCTGVSWDIAICHMMGNVSLMQMGEWKELGQRLPRMLTEAERRGDLLEVTDLRLRLSHAVLLAGDAPERAHTEMDACLASWARKDFDLQHWWALIGRTEIDLYQGNPLRAWERMNGEWGALRWSFLLQVQYIRIESLQHRARAALAASESVSGARRGELLRAAIRDAGKIERQNAPWGMALAILLRAGIAASGGEEQKAMALLGKAEAALHEVQMELYAIVARRWRGVLEGGATGAAMAESADAWMRTQEIRDPERMSRMLAPGFGRR